jgi:GDP-4-dehydro-6-deoxy-D-mannose reductase
MRVLITGAAGFVGRHLTAHLLDQSGDEVWGLVRPSRSPEKLDPRVRVVTGNLCEKATVERALELAQPEAVYHLAGQASVARSLSDPLDTMLNNVVGQVNLLEACAHYAADARILVVGSNEEYGLTRPEELPIAETKELRPISPYAVSKVAQEMLGHQYYAQRGLQVIRARPFTHTGPGQTSLFVTPAFARQLAEMECGRREPRMRVGFLEGQRDFSDVRDVVRGYRLLIERGEAGEVYNLGSGVPHRVRSILDGLLELTQVKPEIVVDQSMFRPLEMPVMYADCSKIYAATGWQTKISFEQMLGDVLDDWRQRVRDGSAGATV